MAQWGHDFSLELWSGGNDTNDTTEVDVDPTNDEVGIYSL